jgi:hypothetical protein
MNSESQPAVPEQSPVFGPIKSTVPYKKNGRKRNGNGGQSTCWSEAQEVALFLFLFMLLLPGFPPVGAVVVIVVVVVNGASSISWLAGGGGAVAAVLKSGSSPTSQSPAERSMGTFRDKQEAASNKQHATSRSSTATTTT